MVRFLDYHRETRAESVTAMPDVATRVRETFIWRGLPMELVPMHGEILAVSPDSRTIIRRTPATRGARLDALSVDGSTVLPLDSGVHAYYLLLAWLDDSTLFMGNGHVPYRTIDLSSGRTCALPMLGGICADMACIDQKRRTLYLVAAGVFNTRKPHTDVWTYRFDSQTVDHLELPIYMGLGRSIEVFGQDTLMFSGPRDLQLVSLKDGKTENLLDSSGALLRSNDCISSLYDNGRRLAYGEVGGEVAVYDFTARGVVKIDGLRGYQSPIVAPNGQFMFVGGSGDDKYPTYRIDNPPFLFPDSGAIEKKK
jgi:hypothetical protein